MLLGLNIGKNAATPIEDATRDYLTCLDGVYPHADYVTVNISSPNTKNLRALQSDAALDGLLEAIAERREQLAQQHARADGTQRRVPLFVKIAPDLDEDQVAVIAATLHAPRHGRRGGHQHHHRPQRRAGHAPRRGNRRPERRPGAGAEQPGDPPAARQRWAAASPSSAWAAS
jgi:hypothetical protein